MNIKLFFRAQTVVSLGKGRTAAGDTLQGVTPEGKKKLWANLQRIVKKRGRICKKVRGDTLHRCLLIGCSSEPNEPLHS